MKNIKYVKNENTSHRVLAKKHLILNKTLNLFEYRDIYAVYAEIRLILHLSC